MEMPGLWFPGEHTEVSDAFHTNKRVRRTLTAQYELR
jgi:hypothetical protein